MREGLIELGAKRVRSDAIVDGRCDCLCGGRCPTRENGYAPCPRRARYAMRLTFDDLHDQGGALPA